MNLSPEVASLKLLIVILSFFTLEVKQNTYHELLDVKDYFLKE